MNTQDPNVIIDRLGGTSETARLCDVKPPSVSEWRKSGIPKAQLKFLKLARPDVFNEACADDAEAVRETKGPMNRMPSDPGRELT